MIGDFWVEEWGQRVEYTLAVTHVMGHSKVHEGHETCERHVMHGMGWVHHWGWEFEHAVMCVMG